MRKRSLATCSVIPAVVLPFLILFGCTTTAPVAPPTMPAERDSEASAPTAATPSGPEDSPSIASEDALFAAPGLNEYAAENLPSFKVFRLSNGIPFIFKENRENRVFALRIIIRGHTAFTPVDKAGIEAVTLAMLTKGSERYSYDEIQRTLYEKTSGIGPSFGSADVTSFGLTTLSKYLPELYDLFADSFLHPTWDPQRFQGVINDFKVGKQRSQNDPYNVSVTTLHRALFAGHPYYADWTGVDDSLSRISLADVVDYYKTMITPSRLFVVAVGDFDSQRLYEMLDRTLGKMDGRDLPVREPPSLRTNVVSKLIEEPFPESKGLAYLRGAFVLPAPSAPDYPALLLAMTMLDDLLYDNVRTRHGAAYSVSVRDYGLAANYGTISIYKTTTPGSVKPLVDESIATLASGKCLAARIDSSAAGKSGIGTTAEPRESSGSFVPIAEALQFYRDQFVTSFYAGQATNRSVAAQIAASLIYHRDYRDYLLLMDRIAAVTPEQIVEATHRYLSGAPMLWAAVGSPDLLSTIDRADFTGSGNRSGGQPNGD